MWVHEPSAGQSFTSGNAINANWNLIRASFSIWFQSNHFSLWSRGPLSALFLPETLVLGIKWKSKFGANKKREKKTNAFGSHHEWRKSHGILFAVCAVAATNITARWKGTAQLYINQNISCESCDEFSISIYASRSASLQFASLPFLLSLVARELCAHHLVELFSRFSLLFIACVFD